MKYMLTSTHNSVMSRHFINVITFWWSEQKKIKNAITMCLCTSGKQSKLLNKSAMNFIKVFPWCQKKKSKQPKSLRKQNVTSLREILVSWELPKPVPNQLCTRYEHSAPPSNSLGRGGRFKTSIYTRNEAADTPSVILYGTPDKLNNTLPAISLDWAHFTD